MLPLPHARRRFLFCGLLAALSTAAWGQSVVRQNVEYSLSGAVAGDQSRPSLGLHPGGGFLVWQDSRIDGRDNGIGAVRLDANLNHVGTPFQVNQSAFGPQEKPQISLLPGGGAVVVWESGTRGFPEVYARFMSAAGTLSTGDLKVSRGSSYSYRRYVTNMPAVLNNRLLTRRFALVDAIRLTRDRSSDPVVTTLRSGEVVVAYSGQRATVTNGMRLETRLRLAGGRIYTNDVLRPYHYRGGWMQDVFLQRYSSIGERLGGEIQINQFAQYNQRSPAIAALPGGGFVAAWISEEKINQFNEYASAEHLTRDQVDVMGRIFAANGSPLTDEFTVNTTTNLCANPAIALLPEGRFLIAWSQRDRVRTNGWDIYSRRFEADGTTTHDVLMVNPTQIGDQFAPVVSSLGTNTLVAWTSMGQDGSREGVYARLLAGGVPVGDEMRVNTTVASRQIHPEVVADGANRFLVAWSSVTRTSAFDILGQRYLAQQPSPAVALQLAAALPASAEAGGAAKAAATGRAAGLETAATPELKTASADVLRVGLALNRHLRQLRWNTTPGARYQVQLSTDLARWADLGEVRAATGTTDSISLTADQSSAFFRVLRLP